MLITQQSQRLVWESLIFTLYATLSDMNFLWVDRQITRKRRMFISTYHEIVKQHRDQRVLMNGEWTMIMLLSRDNVLWGTHYFLAGMFSSPEIILYLEILCYRSIDCSFCDTKRSGEKRKRRRVRYGAGPCNRVS